MDVDAYLARIGVPRHGATLTALHRAHTRAVPFEDYDIHRGVPISLDEDDLFDKIVRRRRGGFCYELNGLFAALLRELGFAVTAVSAFSLDDDGTRGPDFDHMRLVVGDRLVDVGNGAGRPEPVPLVPGEHGDTLVERDGDLWWTCGRTGDGGWKRNWAWTPQPRALADFTARCRYQQTHPESHFVQRRLAVLATRTGRISLLDGVFTEIVDGERIERTLDAEQERALLAERFGIVLDAPLYR